MGDYAPLSADGDANGMPITRGTTRISSLDVFRGLSIALMIFVDYAGSIFPSVAHAPWNGLRLADFVMPFFLFIVGVSLTLSYKRVPNKVEATYKAVLRTAKLFLLGVVLQGGYFHGINSLTFGIDVEKLRLLGILQRIAIAYVVAALCEICSSSLGDLTNGYFWKYYIQWLTIFSLSCVYMVLLYGIYVPDWEFRVQDTSYFLQNDDYVVHKVKCSVRGDLGPACNSAGVIDRYLLGIDHLYQKPTYRNLKECSGLKHYQALESPPEWCLAPFDPEGILSSLTATVTCLVGLHFGHVLTQVEDHKGRLHHWFYFSFSLLVLGLLLVFAGVPLNKSLYTMSYMLVTTGTAGVTFCSLYLLVDVWCIRNFFFVLEWMGRHALTIFILVASNLAVISLQGFYWRYPANNIWVPNIVEALNKAVLKTAKLFLAGVIRQRWLFPWDSLTSGIVRFLEILYVLYYEKSWDMKSTHI